VELEDRAEVKPKGETMPSAIFHFASIEVDLNTGLDIRDITDDLNRIIGRSGVENGTANASIVGSTGSLTSIEYEPGVIQDLKDAINRIAPKNIAYAHEMAWHDGNGHSHVQAALLGPSISLPIRKGRLKLGTWQQVVAINHDNRARKRSIEVTLIGV
jgi:secondary thiamine-phosphate synthase enzyme